MAQFFAIHPTHPQQRLVRRAADIVRAGGLIAYPTDSCYALGCHRGDAKATERLRRIFVEWVQAVETSGSLVVVRTPPGSAHLVALAVDQARFPEIVGTIAGDDALFIAVRSDLPPEPLALRLRDLMEHD